MKLVSWIPAVKKELDIRSHAVTVKTTADVEAGAKARAVVDTGHMKSSIDGQVSGTQGRVSVNADYGIFVELGTSRTAAQPFLGPAAEEQRPAFLAACARIASF